MCLAACLAFSVPSGAAAPAKPPTVSPATYKALEAARKLIGNNQYQVAEEKLKALLPQVADIPYETTLAHQTLAYLFMERQDYARARDALESALQGAALLPPEVVQNLRYNLAQVCLQTERYRRGAEVLEKWYREEKNPSADAWYLGALMQYKQGRYREATPYLQKALAKSGREDWYVLLLSIHAELKEYGKAVPVLRRLISLNPKKRAYWFHLTDIHLMQKDNGRALDTLRLASLKFDLEEKDLLRLVHLYLQADLPYQGARRLEKEMARGKIQRNVRNLELLADSWALARETDNAYKNLKLAAELKNDGALYMRCAHLLLKMERWEEGESMLEKALKRGGIKHPAQAQLMLGIAAFRQGQFDKAEAAFKRASNDKRQRTQALRWLQHVKAERRA